MEALAIAPAKKKKPSRKIPDALVYEIVDGKPIYYKGYREVLKGKLNPEAIMADSTLQTWLKTQLSFLLLQQFAGKNYEIMSGELGILMSLGHRRGADVSIFRKDNLVIDEHFSKTAPEVIIEIDIQADLEDNNEMDYVLRKIEDYLRFGVKQVIWIFTTNRKIMTATPKEPWLTVSWGATIETIEGVSFNLEKMLESKKIG
jgi:hypothetical protein